MTQQIREEGTPILCNYLKCAHGMGQAGLGRCPGDWNDPDCKEFITEKEFEKKWRNKK